MMGDYADLTQMLTACLEYVAVLNDRRLAMLGDWKHVNSTSGEMKKVNEEIMVAEQLIWTIKNVRADFEYMQRKVQL